MVRGSRILIVALSLAVLAGGSPGTAAPGDGAEQAIIQMEKDWAEAAMKHDASPLERIIADDWIGINWDGAKGTKAEVIADVKTGNLKVDSITFDPITVRFFGDTAVATGGDTEKSQYKGKDSSGHLLWTDVYVKRNGRWQAVASQALRFETGKP
jgi:hypothetical protein